MKTTEQISEQITRARHMNRLAELLATTGEDPVTRRQRYTAGGAEQALMWVLGEATSVLLDELEWVPSPNRPGETELATGDFETRPVEEIRAMQARLEADAVNGQVGGKDRLDFWGRLGWSQGASAALLWVLDGDGWTVPAPIYQMVLRPTREELAAALITRVTDELSILANDGHTECGTAANALSAAGPALAGIMLELVDALRNAGIVTTAAGYLLNGRRMLPYQMPEWIPAHRMNTPSLDPASAAAAGEAYAGRWQRTPDDIKLDRDIVPFKIIQHYTVTIEARNAGETRWMKLHRENYTSGGTPRYAATDVAATQTLVNLDEHDWRISVWFGHDADTTSVEPVFTLTHANLRQTIEAAPLDTERNDQ